ncbi:MAG: ROK family protein, partial [Methylotenera sp.]
MTMLIGVDIGGTNLRLGVLDNDLVIEEMRFQANFSEICKNNLSDAAWIKILEVTANLIKSALKKYPNVSSVGIVFPGFIDPITQKITQSPNLPGLLNADLIGDLSQMIHLPVTVENDALAAAYGEFSSLSSAERDLIYVGLGTGVGGGLILDGKPFAGQHGMSMEIGHIITVPYGRLCGCGNHGCMEQYASASGVALSYAELTGITIPADEIAIRARAGDDHAIQAYLIAGLNLATALAHIVKVLDIRLILIGGGMSQAWDLMSQSFQ